jgi:hypothetical protein
MKADLPIPPLGLLKLALANIKHYFIVQNSFVKIHRVFARTSS